MERGREQKTPSYCLGRLRLGPTGPTGERGNARSSFGVQGAQVLIFNVQRFTRSSNRVSALAARSTAVKTKDSTPNRFPWVKGG